MLVKMTSQVRIIIRKSKGLTWIHLKASIGVSLFFLLRVKPYHKNIEKIYCFFSHKLSLSILRKLLINMRRYLIYSLIFKNRTFESTSREFIWYFILSNRSRGTETEIFWINTFFELIYLEFIKLIFHHPKKNWVKENRPYMLGCTEKKYVPINSIQRCLRIYYLFYDIFVMNVIHRTINNNKTGR